MAEESPMKIIVSGTNGELLHEDPASKIEKIISSDVKTDDVNSNEPNGSPGETPVDSEPVSKPKLTPEEYLEKHKINILFEELIYRTLDSTPENPLKFLLSNLETMEKDNWVPGDSQEEKTNAVTKVFKLPEPKKPDPPKGGTVGARTGPGAGRGTTPKVGTGTARAGARTTTTRPAPASKMASSPPKTTTTTNRTTTTTTTKPVAKITATPVKPTTTGASKTTGPTTVRATTAPKAGTGAAKTGATSTTRPATTGATKPTTTATPRRTTTSSATSKTGSNTSISKTGPTKATPTPRSTAKLPSAPGRSTSVPKTPSGAGARTTSTRQPAGRTGRTTGTPGKNPGSAGAKPEVATPPEPEAEPPTPVEEPKAASPEPAEPEPEPKPKTPEPDGAWSKIPGSDEPEVKPLDLEEQLARDDAIRLSDDENIESVEKADSESQSNPSEEVLQVAEPVEKPVESFMTSQDYAADLQSIENEADQANQGDKLEDMVDEGIEVREDFVRSAVPTIPPAMSQVLGAYKSVKKEDNADTTPSDVQNTVEIVVAETEPPTQTESLIDTQETIEPQSNTEIVAEKQTESLIDTQETIEPQSNTEIVAEKHTESLIDTQETIEHQSNTEIVAETHTESLIDTQETIEPQSNTEIVAEKQTEEPQTELQAVTEIAVEGAKNTDLVETSELVATGEEPLLRMAPDDPGIDVSGQSPPLLQQDPVPIVEESEPIIEEDVQSMPPPMPDLLSEGSDLVYPTNPDITAEGATLVTDPSSAILPVEPPTQQKVLSILKKQLSPRVTRR
eukprot:TRINITY_DN1316_c0_g1_i5.p1 TRINITY_DN1316_c0_g1~~TRINITY_DN1316_c0_g1_i5.p1  ORF type:complete len:791 (+),score=191.95 TRINITY_DN1316_c0_g1_i5:51-2423(+)